MTARRILIIQGHPDASQRHFCHALAQAYAEGAVTRAVDLFLNAERLNASSGAGESDAADR